MSLLFRASLRHFLRHPWQLILAITGIALGVAVVVAVGVANRGAKSAFELSMARVTGDATHQIIGGPGGLDDAIYVRLRLAGLRDSAPVVEAYGKAAGETLHLMGIDPFAEGLFRKSVAKTRAADIGTLIARPNTALLAAPTAHRLGVGVGDHIAIRLGSRETSLELIGLIEPDDRGAAAIDGLVVTDISTAQELTAMQGKLSWIDFKAPEGAAGEAMLKAVRRFLPPGVDLVPARSRPLAMEQMTRAFHINLSAMSLLALVVGMFLIYNTMTFAVIQRRAHIGCLRLLGASRQQVVVTVVAEAAVIGIVATLIGMAAGVALGRSLFALVTRTINDLYFVLAVHELEVTPAPLIRGAVLGVSATLVAALVPALEAAMTGPRAALHRSVLEAKSRLTAARLAWIGGGCLLLAVVILAASSRSLAAGFTGLLLFVLGAALLSPAVTAALLRGWGRLLRTSGIPLRLAVRGIDRALSRTGVALAALTLAIATTMGVGIMIESFRATVAQWLRTSFQADIYVSLPGLGTHRTTGGLDPQLTSDLLALPIVRAHSTGRSIGIESSSGVIDVFVLGLESGMTPRYPLKTGTAAEVWPRFQRGDAVLISEPLAYRRRLGPEDSIELRTDHGPRQFPIAAVYYDYSSSEGEVLMPRALYDREFNDPGISGLGLYLKPGVPIDRALATVRETISRANGGLINVRSNRELRELSLDIFDRTFTVTEVLRLLAVIVAMIGILSALMALQLERAAEFGLLRALGFTPGQVYGMVVAQTGATGLIAGLLAVPTGIGLAMMLIEVINLRSFGWTLHTVVPLQTLAGGLAAAVIAALLAGLYPAWKMSRTPPAAALRDE